MQDPSTSLLSTPQEPVCPQCGSAAQGAKFCRSCGLNLESQFQLPTRAEYESRNAGPASMAPPGAAAPPQFPPPVVDAPRFAPPEVASEWPGTNDPSIVAVVLGLVAVVGLFVSSFLPWIDFGDESGSYWRLFSGADILMAILLAATAGALITRLVLPRSTSIAALAILLPTATVAVVYPDTVEALVQISSGPLEEFDFKVGAGLIIAMVVGAVAIAAVIVGAINDGSNATPVRADSLTTQIGLILLAVGGAVTPLVLLLHDEDGVSSWEGAQVNDIVLTVFGVVLAVVAIWALVAKRPPVALMLSMTLGAFLGYALFAAPIESLASGDSSAASIVILVVSAPLLIAGTVLTALTTPRRNAG